MADLTGQTLGKYQVLDRLGRGGMADVYKGYQPGLDRYVAIKVMHAHLSDEPDFIMRFRREAKSVAELHHPNIVQVFDFDVQGDVYYMVMEYIEGGQTLKLRLWQSATEQGKRLSVEQILDLMIKLADALTYAHDKGMIHRDIKPANVLLPSLDRPVLSDFGIARLLGATGLTASGAMIGTPAYMSPEQGRGEHGDARSDIYSLGIVLYEMLTGKPPYDADTPLAIILKHINDPLIPPHVLITPMPEAIERIVLKCLAKDPNDRFASMAELRDALRGAQSELERQKTISTLESPVPAPAPVKPQLQTAKPIQPIQPATTIPCSRSIKPVWLVGGATAVVVIGVIIALALFSRGGVPQSVAPAQVEALLDQCSQQMLAGDLDTARETCAQALKSEPKSAQALVARAIIEIYDGKNMKQAAADIKAAAPTMQDDPLFHLASGLLHRRSEEHLDLPLAEADLSQAIEKCGDKTLLCAAAYEERGKVRAWDLGKPQEALKDFERVTQISSNRQMQADAYSYLADIYFEPLGDLPTAIAHLKKAYQLNNWPGYLEYAARYAVRAKNYDQALDIYNQLLTDEKGDPRLLAGRAFVEWRAGDALKAQQSVDRALQLDPKLLEAHYVRALLLIDARQAK